ncbi:16958_t:CDS:2, partial [Cetraspora pellucida]
ANTNIMPKIEILADDRYKWSWLMNHLVSFHSSILISVSRKDGIEALLSNSTQV